MNFTVRPCFFRNQDLTGSKVKGEDIFVPSLEQTQAGGYWSNCQKQIILFANFEIDKRSDSGSNFVANGNSTTGSTNREF
jgi:hypothetical protein